MHCKDAEDASFGIGLATDPMRELLPRVTQAWNEHATDVPQPPEIWLRTERSQSQQSMASHHR
ncbi:MAG: hypothetical protein C0511_01545 [Hyphomicrobium sp.]|nr:hypothetical protein [Hyphomicrobium sp.]PPC83770.1 MAG: hypothetical protein CTY40_01540 [Hyphomicrobium sp.]